MTKKGEDDNQEKGRNLPSTTMSRDLIEKVAATELCEPDEALKSAEAQRKPTGRSLVRIPCYLIFSQTSLPTASTFPTRIGGVRKTIWVSVTSA